MTTPYDRKTARTARRSNILREKAAERERTEMERTLGDALAAALIRYLAGAAPASVTNVKRALTLSCYSDELKRLIVLSIETNPAMEESFLKIAELAFADGEEAACEASWDSY